MIIDTLQALNKTRLLAAAVLASAATAFAPASMAEESTSSASDLVVNEASSLDELLENVQARRVVESRENTARERRFANEKAEQARLLQEAEAERRREQRRSDRLETQFEENEIRIGDLTEQLDITPWQPPRALRRSSAGRRRHSGRIRRFFDLKPVR